METHDWQGSTFDPNVHRPISILPDHERDEAHCTRHDRAMKPFNIVAYYTDAEYELAPEFNAFTCEACLTEILNTTPHQLPPAELLRGYAQHVFRNWNNGTNPANYFIFVRENDTDLDPDDIRINILDPTN